MDLCSRYRGTQQEYKVLETTGRAVLRYLLPLSGESQSLFGGEKVEPISVSSEIVTDFFSELKSSSSGFASFDYEKADYGASPMVKVGLPFRNTCS